MQYDALPRRHHTRHQEAQPDREDVAVHKVGLQRGPNSRGVRESGAHGDDVAVCKPGPQSASCRSIPASQMPPPVPPPPKHTCNPCMSTSCRSIPAAHAPLPAPQCPLPCAAAMPSWMLVSDTPTSSFRDSLQRGRGCLGGKGAHYGNRSEGCRYALTDAGLTPATLTISSRVYLRRRGTGFKHRTGTAISSGARGL